MHTRFFSLLGKAQGSSLFASSKSTVSNSLFIRLYRAPGAILLVIVIWAGEGVCQNVCQKAAGSARQITKSEASVTLPAWLPFPIPIEFYQYIRKYGPWDTKQQGYKYREFTQFNFGATGSAAGLDEGAILALDRASKPNPTDLQQLEKAELDMRFRRKPIP